MIGHPGVVTRGVKPIDRVKERVQVGSFGDRLIEVVVETIPKPTWAQRTKRQILST